MHPHFLSYFISFICHQKHALDDFFQDTQIVPRLEHLNVRTSREIAVSDIITFLTSIIEVTCGDKSLRYERQDRLKSLIIDVDDGEGQSFDFPNLFKSSVINEDTKTKVSFIFC